MRLVLHLTVVYRVMTGHFLLPGWILVVMLMLMVVGWCGVMALLAWSIFPVALLLVWSGPFVDVYATGSARRDATAGSVLVATPDASYHVCARCGGASARSLVTRYTAKCSYHQASAGSGASAGSIAYAPADVSYHRGAVCCREGPVGRELASPCRDRSSLLVWLCAPDGLSVPPCQYSLL